jgi:DNA polymerase
MFRFYGAARSGRWAGRLVQLQNLPQNHLEALDAVRCIVHQPLVPGTSGSSGCGGAAPLGSVPSGTPAPLGSVPSGAYETLKVLYDSVPDVLSELLRTAFIPAEGKKFIVCDFSAIEARVIAWLAGESWRQEVFAKGGDIYCASASAMFHVPVEKHGVNGHLRQKGKIAELALGYGGGVGALKSMGALEMGVPENELQPLVDAWRSANPNIVRLWWNVDKAVKTAIRQKTTVQLFHLKFSYRSGMLFITLPSGRALSYPKPRLCENKFGGESVCYMGPGPTRRWEQIESYGPKFVENIVQGISRDLLVHAMFQLQSDSKRTVPLGPTDSCVRIGSLDIVAHVHDEVILETDSAVTVEEVADKMSVAPHWAKGLILRGDGYSCDYYRKD